MQAMVMFLSETKLSKREMENRSNKWEQYDGVYVDSSGRSEGLALLWKKRLGFNGYEFTWWNRREGGELIEERLDRFLINNEWFDAFSFAEVIHVDDNLSDHLPIKLKLNNKSKERWKRRRNRKFEFENMWALEESCRGMVEGVWSTTHQGMVYAGSILEKMEDYKAALLEWSKQEFGNVREQINEITEALRWTKDVEAQGKLMKELREWRHKEEVMWWQRSSVDFLKYEDQNSRWLHEKATQRRQNNYNYFENIFTSSNPSNMEAEVAMALKQMHPRKAPGPDAQGSRWVVGNGEEVRVWSDPWLPRPLTFKVISPRRDSDEDLRFWKRIWNCSLPPRIKMVAWKAAREALATKLNVARRVHGCKMNGVDEELWSLGAPKMRDWLEVVMSGCDERGREVVLTLLWAVWGARDKAIYDKGSMLPNRIVENAISFVYSFQDNMVKDSVSKQESGRRWKPPNAGVWKLNSDAGTTEGGGVGCGFSIRDGEWDIVAVGIKHWVGHMNLEVHEAHAVLFSVRVAWEAGYRRLVVESDCLGLVQQHRGAKATKSTLGMYVEEILQWVKYFEFISWSYVSRNGNKVAHYVAKLIPFVNGERIWLED
ncbi:Formate--tetrahydrofolate ligase 2, partial [Bienertia sinuspersici]